MKLKIFCTIVALTAISLGSYYFYDQKREAKAPTISEIDRDKIGRQTTTSNTNTPAPATSSEQTTNTNTNSSPTPPNGGVFSDESGLDGPDINVVEVVYNGTSFVPASVSIKVGDIVVFRNTSSGAFWPASDPHPSHTNYSGFDAGGPVAAGQTFQFKFTKVGQWGYHNHLNPLARGVVRVAQ